MIIVPIFLLIYFTVCAVTDLDEGRNGQFILDLIWMGLNIFTIILAAS